MTHSLSVQFWARAIVGDGENFNYSIPWRICFHLIFSFSIMFIFLLLKPEGIAGLFWSASCHCKGSINMSVTFIINVLVFAAIDLISVLGVFALIGLLTLVFSLSVR